MKTLFQIITIIICLIPLCPALSLADEPVISPDSHIQEGDRYFRNNQYFMAVNEYEQALQKNANDPDLFRKLSFLHYHLGFLDKAVSDMEKAVSLSPHSELLRLELGIAYLAKNTLDNAKEQFMAVIARNPGLANAYYYLGEIFYRKKDYGMAWMFVKRSQCLGHRGRELLMKLSAVSEDPNKDLCVYIGEDLYIRQILVDTKSRAEEVAKRIEAGELFEDVATAEDMNRNLNVGGYLGKLAPSELHPDIVQALTENKAFSPPVTVETESGFHIVQRIAPFDISYWKTMLSDSARQNKKQTQEKGGFSDALVVANLNPAPSNSKEFYIVYAGSYRQEQYAIEDVDKLLRLGYPSYRYEETTESKGTFYIVVAGKYESLERAKESGEDIARQGFNYFIRKTN
ncbi:MAG: tetratricopeptide repeat protein [Nitrospirae bacterium]|nr:tetratricopeptide repeat protein [Nitrospirota bacterium]